MGIAEVAEFVVGGVGVLFKKWSSLIVAPVFHLEMLWIIIPIYINWFLGEYFQEKGGTKFGSAITNGFTLLWACLDWTRTLYTSSVGVPKIEWLPFIGRLILSVLVGLYGFSVMYFAIKGKKLAQLIGRVRGVTYVLVCFTPIVYGVISVDLALIASIAFFFPFVYFVIEMVLRKLPSPFEQ